MGYEELTIHLANARKFSVLAFNDLSNNFLFLKLEPKRFARMKKFREVI